MSAYDVALDLLIQRGVVPKVASDLMLADSDGWTIAHTCATHGRLPVWFDNWTLADNHGYTVAHAKASVAVHPVNFPYWEMKDKHGRTVAEIAAEIGTLPVEYTKWDSRTANGDTLAHVAARASKLPPKIMDSRRIMALTDRRGITVADVLKERGNKILQACRELLQRRQATI